MTATAIAIPRHFRDGLNDAVISFAKAGVVFAEAYEVAVRPKFDTAAWSFMPPHRIWLGENMLSRGKSGLSLKDKVHYASAFVRHEFSHMRWTTKRMKAFGEVLALEELPFSLWNLFEDARIEDRSRKATGRKFEWLRFENVTTPTTPSGLMFSLIQSEGELTEPHYVLPIRAEPSETVWSAFAKVLQFYREIIAAATSEDLLPIMRRWVKEFPAERRNTPQHGEGRGGRGRGDYCAGLTGDAISSILSDEKRAAITATLDEGSVVMVSIPGKGKGVDKVDFESTGNGKVLGDTQVEFSADRASKVADTLSRILVKPAGWVSRDDPTRKVDVRSAAMAPLAGWKFRAKEAPQRRGYKIGIVFDCSGSMSHGPLAEGKVLVAALSLLAQRKLLSGVVALSVVSGSRSLWERFELPMSQEAIERIDAYGAAEGLQQTLMENAEVLSEMDQVLVYTDADICDKPLDRAALARKRIHPVGLYVGEQDAAEAMAKHFGEFLIRPTVEALAEAFVARFKVRGR